MLGPTRQAGVPSAACGLGGLGWRASGRTSWWPVADADLSGTGRRQACAMLILAGVVYAERVKFLSRRSSATQVPTSKAYLYVSDAKVEMLIDGMRPSWRDRFDLKVKAGIPALNAEVSPRQLDLGRFTRAERLCAALDAEGRIGSALDEESEFFRGQMLTAWGFWSRPAKGYADVVFFTGFLDQNNFVGLGGSAYHTMERAGDRLQQYSNSGISALMAFMKERSEAEGLQHPYQYFPPGAWDSDSWDADHDNPVLPEEVEFVAQRLLDQKSSYGPRTIIGSPIYVARTGRPITGRTLREYEAIRNRHAIQHYGKPRLEPRHGRWEIGKRYSPRPAPLLEAGEDTTDT